jgi:hypothetical protein
MSRGETFDHDQATSIHRQLENQLYNLTGTFNHRQNRKINRTVATRQKNAEHRHALQLSSNIQTQLTEAKDAHSKAKITLEDLKSKKRAAIGAEQKKVLADQIAKVDRERGDAWAKIQKLNNELAEMGVSKVKRQKFAAGIAPFGVGACTSTSDIVLHPSSPEATPAASSSDDTVESDDSDLYSDYGLGMDFNGNQ